MKVMTMAQKKESMTKDNLAKLAYKSHFTRASSRASIDSPNKISEMIKGYAQVATQKTKPLNVLRKTLIRSKTIQQLLMPAYSSESEDELIAIAQQRIKQTIAEKPQVARPTFKPTTIVNSKKTWMKWKSTMKQDLKTIESNKFTLTATLDFASPMSRRSSLPELTGMGSLTTTHRRSVKQTVKVRSVK